MIKPIKERQIDNMKTKNRIRMIENPKKRIVHFYFKAAFPWIESEFTIWMRLYLKKWLETYITSQQEKMEEYIRKIQNDELEDSTRCPIK